MLCAVSERGAYANLLLPATLAERGITGRDAALATELTYGTLRGRGSYDAILAACCDRDLSQLDTAVREVLRLGAHQLLATRIGPHAAVATSVDLVRYAAGPRPAGFVNAVLRRVAQHDVQAWLKAVAPSPADDPDGYLAVRYSHPRWIVSALRASLTGPGDGLAGSFEPGGNPAGSLEPGGNPAGSLEPGGNPAGSLEPGGNPAGSLEPGGGPAGSRKPAGGPAGSPDPAASLDQPELGQALAANQVPPAISLCAVPGLASPQELIAAGADAARWSPCGARLSSGGDPARFAAVRQRRAAVQDEASQLAALALAAAPVIAPDDVPATGSASDSFTTLAPASGPDQRWLDLCAGPGGKARLLAGLAAGHEARLLAADLHQHRAQLAAAAIGKSGSGAAVVADGTRPAWRAAAFDRVLADVPCTGLGALRRRPDSRWRHAPGDLPGLTALQRRLLHIALDSARPGGVVAYVTCSPHLAETRDVVAAVLADRADTVLLDAPAIAGQVIAPGPGPAGIAGLRSGWLDGRCAQFWPHRHGTDAIFLALLRRS